MRDNVTAYPKTAQNAPHGERGVESPMHFESAPRAFRSGELRTLDAIAPRAIKIALVVSGVAMTLAIVAGAVEEQGMRRFFFSYLVNYAFFLSISLGALVFVALQHVTRAGWSVTVRRLNEILAANLPLLSLMFVPLAVSLFLPRWSPFPWADPEQIAGSELIQHKQAYLNAPFFIARAALYLGLWTWMARFFFSRSVRQDESGDPELTLQMERFSGPAILLFGLSVTFASFDWLMSIEPEWFSSIFGVYYFSGAVVGSLAAAILLAIALQHGGRVTESITVEHYHDLGKLLFAFVVFWGYIAFSQYLLIWYANIAEETTWYMKRQTPAWLAASLALVLGHLLIPFLGMISREAKRRKAVLGFWAVWLLVFHWLDMHYLVMPSFNAERFSLGLMDLCLLLGLGGLYAAGALRVARAAALVPIRDPRLGEAVSFENV